MTPKFITLHRFTDALPVMVNPRRVDCVFEERRKTAQPDYYCGTVVSFGKVAVLVKETPDDIKKLLS